MRPTLSILAGALLPLPILLACAAGAATAQASNVITAPELAAEQGGSTYDAVRHIRPELFRSRDDGSLMLFSARMPAVAVNDSLVGGIDILRTLPVNQVVHLEYINAPRAAKQYGMTFRDGILLVQTRGNTGYQLSIAR
jgi:hypothetical protein